MNDSLIPDNAVIRPWGWYLATFQTEGYKTKIFSVAPGKRLSLQSHSRRKEMWSVVRGEGLCTVGNNLMQVSENSLISVPRGIKHRIENISTETELVISVAQVGDYLEEDDIVRYKMILECLIGGIKTRKKNAAQVSVSSHNTKHLFCIISFLNYYVLCPCYQNMLPFKISRAVSASRTSRAFLCLHFPNLSKVAV